MMGRRVGAVLALFGLIGFERLGWYSMRMSLGLLAPDNAAELMSSSSSWVLWASVLAAIAAVVVPRVVLLVSGCALALSGAALMFTSVDVKLAVSVQSIGVGIERVVWLTMLAELAARPMVKLALVAISYAIINIGAALAFPVVAALSVATLVSFVITTLLAVLVAALRAAPTSAPSSSGEPLGAIVALVLAAPAMVTQWELSARVVSFPAFDFMSHSWSVTTAVVAGCGLAALAFVASRRVTEVLTVVLAAGAVSLAVCCAVAVMAAPQTSGGLLALNFASAVVEGFLYGPLLGLVIGSSPPRLGPIFAACVLYLSSVVARFEAAPALLHDVLMLGGSVVTLSLAVAVVLLRKRLFAPFAAA